MAAVGDRDVDCDPVQPGLDRRFGLPRAPVPVGALECLLGAVFRGCLVADERDQGAEDAAIGFAVQALEVRL
jgi:hypothetical protein